MTRTGRITVFSLVYGIAYLGFFFYSEFYKIAMFRYYPVLHTFSRANLPLAEAGPAILWYSWLLGAAVVALVTALIVPSRLAERLTGRAAWVVPLALLIGTLVYERRWFY